MADRQKNMTKFINTCDELLKNDKTVKENSAELARIKKKRLPEKRFTALRKRIEEFKKKNQDITLGKVIVKERNKELSRNILLRQREEHTSLYFL